MIEQVRKASQATRLHVFFARSCLSLRRHVFRKARKARSFELGTSTCHPCFTSFSFSSQTEPISRKSKNEMAPYTSQQGTPQNTIASTGSSQKDDGNGRRPLGVQKPGAKSQKRCWVCQRPGHIARNCQWANAARQPAATPPPTPAQVAIVEAFVLVMVCSHNLSSP